LIVVIRTFLLINFVFFGLPLWSQNPLVVGYLPYYRFELAGKIDYAKLTHLNLAFLNPDTLGNLSIGDKDITPIVSLAKSIHPEIRVFISIAGGHITPEWQAAYDKFLRPEYRSEFIALLMNYLSENELDGIDVDLEWGSVNEFYSPFVLELADSVRARDLQLSAALPATYRYPQLSPQALDAFDLVHIMAYDLTGPWAPDRPGPHSPLSLGPESIGYWLGQGARAEQLTLGLPFYGYDFGRRPDVGSFTFASMVAENTAYARLDQVGERYYNGIPTIQLKTWGALQEVAGVMIWELGQDAFEPHRAYSLLDAVDGVVSGNTIPVTALPPATLAQEEAPVWYPNPFGDELWLHSGAAGTATTVRIADLQGRVVFEKTLNLTDAGTRIEFPALAEGVYVGQVILKGYAFTSKLVKH
jgi:chitinase